MKTTTSRSSVRAARARAAATAVVPTSMITDSPSRISSAAARPIASFSIAKLASASSNGRSWPSPAAGHRPAADPEDLAPLGEDGEVVAGGHLRDAELAAQLVDPHERALVDHREHPVAALVGAQRRAARLVGRRAGGRHGLATWLPLRPRSLHRPADVSALAHSCLLNRNDTTTISKYKVRARSDQRHFGVLLEIAICRSQICHLAFYFEAYYPRLTYESSIPKAHGCAFGARCRRRRRAARREGGRQR